MSIEILTSVPDLRRYVSARRSAGDKLAYVPTMGGLHEGHVALVRHGYSQADLVGASIFVNPKQFNRSADLARYPRSFEDDLAILEDAGAAFVFAPDVDVMYPDGFETLVHVGGLSDPLCGGHRPGHFDGVTTVVTKLLLQCLPDIAVFGEKDFQQLRLVQRLVRDLDIPVRIVGHPTVREADGVAMSSRNRYLTSDQRAVAPEMYRSLQRATQRVLAGDDTALVSAESREALVAAGFRSVDYFELRAEDDLRLLPAPEMPCRLFAAAHLGEARLIDNVAVV